MKDDPIVAEVRKGRQEHAAKFKYDLEAIVKDIQSREGKDGQPLVTLPPRLKTVAQPRGRRGPRGKRLTGASPA
jgi:hypothetical protein